MIISFPFFNNFKKLAIGNDRERLEVHWESVGEEIGWNAITWGSKVKDVEGS